MKRLFILSAVLLFFIGCDTINNSEPGQNREFIEPDFWINAYLASWNHGSDVNQLPTNEIDWQAFTHLSYAGVTVKPDGSLTPVKSFEQMPAIGQKIDQIVARAHQEGIPVLLSLGGWQSQQAFQKAASPEVRPTLISNIITMLEMHGLDGIDLNIEPIDDATAKNYMAFVKELKEALNAKKTPLLSKPLLTAGTIWQPEMFAGLHQQFDQINLLTYNYSGAWDDWVSWHNSPLFNGGNTFPGSDEELPSINKSIKRYIGEGVPKEKLGIGIDFYGYVWQGGVHAPLQSWESTPDVMADVPYFEIMGTYYKKDFYRWDDGAKAPYLSIDQEGSENDTFISYDDEKAVHEKINYVKNENLGGAIIWELSGGYRKEQPQGKRNPLLQAVKEAIAAIAN